MPSCADGGWATRYSGWRRQAPGNFFLGCASFLCRGCMCGDTPVATQADCDGQRDQFARFGPKTAGVGIRLPKLTVALHSVGTQLGKTTDAGRELPAIAVPVDHVHFGLSTL